MARDYIPTRQNDLLEFMLRVAALLMANPYLYGITPQQAAEFNAAVQNFKTKMDLMNEPGGARKSEVQAKNESKLSLLLIARPLLQYIKDNAGVANDDKVDLGLNVNGTVKTRVPPPNTAPTLKIKAATTRQHVLTYRDAADENKRGKPAGVAALELFCQISATPDGVAENAKFVALLTKQPFVMDFLASDVGKYARYWARWVNAKGVPGPWSDPVTMTVAGQTG